MIFFTIHNIHDKIFLIFFFILFTISILSRIFITNEPIEDQHIPEEKKSQDEEVHTIEKKEIDKIDKNVIDNKNKRYQDVEQNETVKKEIVHKRRFPIKDLKKMILFNEIFNKKI